MIHTFDTVTNSGLHAIKQNTLKLSQSIGRISSGQKIVSPGDDASGYAKSKEMESAMARLSASNFNIQNAISYTQTSVSFMGQIADVVTRMSEIASSAKDFRDPDKDNINYEDEFNELAQQLEDIIGTGQEGNDPHATFNETDLFGPKSVNGVTAIITDGSSSNPLIMPEINLRSGAIAKFSGRVFDFNSVNFVTMISDLKDAIEQVGNSVGKMSGVEYRLQQSATGNDKMTENFERSLSRIRDTDIAAETSRMAKFNVIVQAANSVMAQANTDPRRVIEILG